MESDPFRPVQLRRHVLPPEPPPMLRLTNSEMTQWRTCPRHWYLASYRGFMPKRAAAGNPLTLGTRVHNALEAYYQPDVFTDADAREAIMGSVRSSIQADCEAFPSQEFAIMKEAELAEIMLDGYIDWVAETGADADLRVLAAEAHVEVPLIEGRATLLTKLDAIVERKTDGRRMNLEHKTVQSLKAHYPLLQTNTQLLTEHLAQRIDLAAKGRSGEAADGVLYNMLRKVKRTAKATPPFYGRETVTHSEQELLNHFWHVQVTAAQILAARERLDGGESHHAVCPPNPHDKLTWWSQFFKDGVYELMDAGRDWEDFAAHEYIVGDPLERYQDSSPYDESW